MGHCITELLDKKIKLFAGSPPTQALWRRPYPGASDAKSNAPMATPARTRETLGAAHHLPPAHQVDPLGQVAMRTRLTRWVSESGDQVAMRTRSTRWVMG